MITHPAPLTANASRCDTPPSHANPPSRANQPAPAVCTPPPLERHAHNAHPTHAIMRKRIRCTVLTRPDRRSLDRSAAFTHTSTSMQTRTRERGNAHKHSRARDDTHIRVEAHQVSIGPRSKALGRRMQWCGRKHLRLLLRLRWLRQLCQRRGLRSRLCCIALHGGAAVR